ncbi:MAG: hypothetical protein JWL76_1855 [Thermoleophilia bacterium]|nr:hypothetical protein [Thermoleophilia bacterium]
MSALAATAVRMPAVAGAPLADAVTLPDTPDAPKPTTLRWEGQPQGWWSRNGLAFGLGAGFGAMAGFGGAMMASSIGRSTPQVAAIAAAAALGIGGATFGITTPFRRNSDHVPDAPTGPAPTLPAGTPLAPVHGGEATRGTHVAHGDGSYTEQVPVTHYRTGSDGKTESYTVYETQWRYFNWDVSTEAQVGRRDGYATMQDALEDVAAGDATALRRQDGRIVAYDMQSRSHWGDVDDLVVYDQATEAIVSPSGRIWLRDQQDPEFRRGATIERPDPTGIVGKSVGEHELRYRSNPDVRVGTVLSGRRGHEDLASAVGEAQARPGNQVVTLGGGRYHVAEATGEQLDHAIPNDGFVTTEHAEHVAAVEQEGAVWAPSGDWYVAPRGS